MKSPTSHKLPTVPCALKSNLFSRQHNALFNKLFVADSEKEELLKEGHDILSQSAMFQKQRSCRVGSKCNYAYVMFF